MNKLLKTKKLLKIIPAVILLIALLCAFFPDTASSILSAVTDEYMWIGTAKIRDDYDSSKVRVNKKLARELDVQLFDFNPLHFNWSSSTGLNLSAGYFQDSIASKIFCVNKDSVAGETVWNKYYSIKRPYYNIYDSTLLLIKYFNTRWNSSAQWHLINTYGELSNETTLYTLTTSLVALKEWVLPHSGNWRVEAFFEYEFALDSIVNWGTQDSIYCVLDYEEPASKGHWVKKIYSPYNTKSGEAGTGYISLIVPSGISGGNFYASATDNAQNTAGAVKRYLRGLRINIELIQ